MTEHNATIVDGSAKIRGSNLMFVTRCCGDESTDHPVTIANAGRLTKADVEFLKDRQIRAAADHHKNMCQLLEHLK